MQTEFSAGKTTCPYCGVGCGVEVSIDKGQPVIAGDMLHPANAGNLCLKGQSLAETLSLEGRLLHPTVDGKQTRWSEALDLVAHKIAESIDKHGSESVAFYVSGQLLTEDYYVANKLVKGYFGTGNIDTNSRLCMASSVAGHKRAFGSDLVPGCYEDLELADLVILVGSNLAWCHPVLFNRITAARDSNPEKVIVNLDPRRTATADLSDIHLSLNADSDTALFGGLLNFLANTDRNDQQFIDNCTGLDEALDAVADLSVRKVSKLTGLPESDIEGFYKRFSETKKVVTVYSQGVNQSVAGTDKVNAIINCHLYTGRVGVPGSGPFSITGQPNAMGGREVGGLANTLACHMELSNPFHRNIVQNYWGSPTIADKPGLTAVDLFEAIHQGKIRVLWIMATNPLVSMPDADFIKSALARCDFVVQSDVVTNNDTSALAHVRLPAQAWGEKDGTVTNSERCISRQRRFRMSPGETRPDWWAVAEVAKRLGFTESFDYANPAQVFAEYAALSGYRNNGSRDFDISAYSNIDSQTYGELQPFYWPASDAVEIPRKPIRLLADGKFFNDDGCGKFIPVKAIESVEPLNFRTLHFNTGRSRDQWHTMTRTGNSPTLASHTAEPYLEIHPADADVFGVKSADIVSVINEKGQFDARVVETDRVKVGSCFSPMHWCAPYASQGIINTVTQGITDPVSRQPALKHSRVSIKKRVFSHYGFVVSQRAVSTDQFDYYSQARCSGGWRTEFALVDCEDLTDLPELINLPVKNETLTLYDKAAGRYSQVSFAYSCLTSVLVVSTEPVAASRSWLSSLLNVPYKSSDRHMILAGLQPPEARAAGELVCSCMMVGELEICSAVKDGFCTISTVGEATSAGTNCGSCRGDIAALIKREVMQKPDIFAQNRQTI